MKNSIFKSVGYSILIILLIVLLHRIPLYYLFENIGLSDSVADLLDKIILNLIVIFFAINEIIRLNLWTKAGLSFKKMHDPHLYLILLFYLFIFTGGFSILKIIDSKDLVSAIVGLFLIKSITVGILEEVVFRGLIQSKIIESYEGQKNGIIKGVLISAFLFGIAHLVNIGQDYISIDGIIRQIFAAFCLGSLFGVILLRTKNVYPIIITHFAISFFSLLGTLFPEYFPDEMQTEKTYFETIATLVFTVVVFGSALLIAFYLFKNYKQKNYRE